MNILLWLKHGFRSNRKGFSSVVGALFMVMMTVCLASAYFVYTLSQNNNYNQAVKAQNQVELDRQSEYVTATEANFTINEQTVTVEVTISNLGSIPVELKTLWVLDSTVHSYNYLNTTLGLRAGNSSLYNIANGNAFSLNLDGQLNETDAFSGWFVTARGNTVPIVPLNGTASGGNNYYYYYDNSTGSEGDGGDFRYSSYLNVGNLTQIMGDFIPDYHSVQWAQLTPAGSNHVGTWNDGWIIPSADQYQLVWRINMTYYGNQSITIDQNSMLFFNPFSGQNPGGKAPPLCYIVSFDAASKYIYPYPGNETVITPAVGGSRVALYFGSSDAPGQTGGIQNRNLPGNLMSLTIYGKSPSTYAQSFPLFAVSTRDPTVTVDPTSRTVGSSVTVLGTGFTAFSTITVKYDGVIITTSPSPLVSNAAGSFTATFTVPASKSGSHTVLATDASSHTGQTTLTVTPSISVNPAFGLPGTNVTIIGKGFKDNSLITVTYDGITLTTSPASLNSNATGSFIATFQVPASQVGIHSVVARDAVGNTGAIPFTVADALVTITSNPTGSGFVIVDGANITTPTTIYTWTNGSTHEIQAVSTVLGPSGTQYIFNGWNDGANQTQLFTVQQSCVTLTADYTTQYFLSVNSGGFGTVTGENWYDAGSAASFSISPTVIPGGEGSQSAFANWVGTGSGSYNGSASTYSVVMNNSITETASWVTQYQVSAQYSTSDGSTPTSDVILSGTRLGLPYTMALTQSNQSTFLDANTLWSLNPTVPASPTTEKWVAYTGTSGNVSSITDVNVNYYHQYYLTVHSAVGNATGQGWYNAGSTATSSVTTPVDIAGPPSITYNLTSYTGTGSAPSGSNSTMSFVINSPSTVTWNWHGVLTIYSSGTGSTSLSRTSSSGYSYNWQCVSDYSQADGNNYVYRSSTSNATDYYATQGYGQAIGTINSVTEYIRCIKTGSGLDAYAQTYIRLSSIGASGTQINLTTSWANYSQTFSRPGGGTWSWTDIGNLQCGVSLQGGSGSNDARCTLVWLVVEFTA